MTSRMFWVLIAAVIVCTGAIVAHGVWADAALETHEIFVAQTTREMLASGDMIVPRFGGEVRLQKPPAMYWAVAAVATMVDRPDVPAWVARAPSAVSALVVVAVCIGLGVRVYDRCTGLVAGAIVGFSAGMFEYGVNARPEMLYAACTGVSTLGFVAAHRASSRRASLWWAVVGWVACGLAMLAKGPQLPVLILAGLSVWHIRVSGWAMWRRAVRPVMGVAIVAAVVAPWVVALSMRVDGAMAFWMRELIGLRFASEGGAGIVAWVLELLSPEYLWYGVSQLLPWGLVLPLAFFVAWQRGRPDLACGRDLFFAMVVPVVVLSLASRTREYYLLPILPIAAVLLARGVLDLLDKAERSNRFRRIAAAALIALAAASLAFAVGVEVASDLTSPEALGVVAGFALAGAFVVWVGRTVFSRSMLTRLVVAALSAWGAAFAVLGHNSVLHDERSEHVESVAIAAANLSGGEIPVVSIGFDRDDLIYQVNRPIRRLPGTISAQELRAEGPAIVVARPSVLDRLAAEGAPIERGPVFTIEKGERYEVARLIPDASVGTGPHPHQPGG
jgi:4-amino-4-deoxy-L-arabinose transferase-like glycosyltransferase